MICPGFLFLDEQYIEPEVIEEISIEDDDEN